ncbi:MAG TPA: hopanoid-associated sugar epimerase [Syntrophorhabdales bacterium]|nr:hopanoid-associated sugar epimerase [Syntrophorhabdales bacterium]
MTGATGFVGFHVAKALQEKGVEVRALVRASSDTSDLAPLGVELVTGDIRDYDSVRRALQGCGELYHVAADYRLWVPDPEAMYETNVQGTVNVMQAALEAGTGKVVYTSSAGTLVPKRSRGKCNEETPVCLSDMVGHYKRSKFLAERHVYEFISRGLPIVIVNPTTPIGPMDRKPTPTGKVIVDFLSGRMPAFIDTGLNFVDVEEVGLGHWLASQYGKSGEHYILGNRNMSLGEFLAILGRIGERKPPRVKLPYVPVLLAAYVDEAVSTWIRHTQPTIPLTGVKMAKSYMYFDCSKAVHSLGVPQMPVERAMQKSIDWYLERGYVRNRPSSGGRHVC